MTTTSDLYIGVDIGGTKVAAGVVDREGTILYKTRTPMMSRGTAEEAFASVRQAIDSVIAAHPTAHFRGIGVSAPGPLDPRTGIVIYTPNLPAWRNFGLADEIKRTYQMPTRVDNDANAAGLAEALWGSGAGHKDVFYATVGTGIGTAIVIDRKLYYGRTGLAAEGGHMTIDLNGPIHRECGKRGCVEFMASGTAIGRRARARVQADPVRGAKLLELAGGNIEAIAGETVGKGFADDDPLSKEILRDTADILTVWLGNIIDLLEPEVIVVGGGVGRLISEYFVYMRENISHWSINPRAIEIPIVRAKYGADSGIAGSAALLLQ